MGVNIETRAIAPRRFVGVRRVVQHTGIGPACGEILPRLWTWLCQKGVAPDGPPAVMYYALNGETGEFDIMPVVFVADAVEGEGDITVGETPGGEALVATHVGPYETLGQSWEVLILRAPELGRKVTTASWELYIDDPGSVSPEALRTELYLPVDPGR